MNREDLKTNFLFTGITIFKDKNEDYQFVVDYVLNNIHHKLAIPKNKVTSNHLSNHIDLFDLINYIPKEHFEICKFK